MNRNALREAELLVKVQSFPVQASELARRGKLKDAISMMGQVEQMAAELKMILANNLAKGKSNVG